MRFVTSAGDAEVLTVRAVPPSELAHVERYAVTGDAPWARGGSKVTCTRRGSDTTAARIVGSVGRVGSTSGADDADQRPGPALFTARASQGYVAPGCSPGTSTRDDVFVEPPRGPTSQVHRAS